MYEMLVFWVFLCALKFIFSQLSDFNFEQIGEHLNRLVLHNISYYMTCEIWSANIGRYYTGQLIAQLHQHTVKR